MKWSDGFLRWIIEKDLKIRCVKDNFTKAFIIKIKIVKSI